LTNHHRSHYPRRRGCVLTTLGAVAAHLVIVESPAKAKTIKRFLSADFAVEASMGHVRDLPGNTLAVDVDKDFSPLYEVPKEKESVVKKLQKAFKDADDLWIATDEDREGEAIGWHITQVLGLKDSQKAKRIVFRKQRELSFPSKYKRRKPSNSSVCPVARKVYLPALISAETLLNSA